MAQDTVERAALGRFARLGDLYDARSDSFCGISIFKKDPPKCTTKSQDNQHTQIDFIKSDSIQEKFSKLEVCASLQVSVMAGLFTIGGSGRYLSESKTSSSEAQCTLMFNVKTMKDTLELFFDELTDCISTDALQHRGATHVVIGIEWGANALLTTSLKVREKEDKTQVEAKLTAKLLNVKFTIEGSGEVNYAQSDVEKDSTFKYQIYGDLLPKAKESMPTTFEGMVEMMKALPSMIHSQNDGSDDSIKGVPLKYVLFPLSSESFEAHFGVKMVIGNALENMTLSNIQYFVSLLDEVDSCARDVNEFVASADECENKFGCIGRDVVKQMKALKTQLCAGQAQFRADFALKLRAIRSGEMGIEELDVLRTSYMEGDDNAARLRERCQDIYKPIKPIISFAKLCTKRGIVWLKSREMLDHELVDNETVLILYADKASKADDSIWDKYRSAFFKMVKANARKSSMLLKTAFMFCDGDSNPDLFAGKGLRIEKYEHGQRVCDDVLKYDDVDSVKPATPSSPSVKPSCYDAPQGYVISLGEPPRVLTVLGSSSDTENKVALRTRDGTDAQMWYDHPETGTLRTKLNGYVLDFSPDGKGCATVKPFKQGNADQQWARVGNPIICHRQKTNKVLDSSCGGDAVIVSSDAAGQPKLTWNVLLPSRKFTVMSIMHGKVLSVKNDSTTELTPIIVNPRSSSEGQVFYEDDCGYLRTALNDFGLDCGGFDTPVVIRPFYRDNLGQQWQFDGLYIKNKTTGLVLDIFGGKEGDGVPVYAYKLQNSTNQKWYKQYV